jgi:TonB family protein
MQHPGWKKLKPALPGQLFRKFRRATERGRGQTLSAGGTLLGFVLTALPSQAQITQATIQEIIHGNQVGNQVYIQNMPAKVKDQANFGQIVLTQEARAGLTFNNGAQGRLGRQTRVTVGQCVDVVNGELLASGPVTGCVANLTVSVLGTLYVLQKNEVPAATGLEGQLQGLQSRLAALENQLSSGQGLTPPAQAQGITGEGGTVKVLAGVVTANLPNNPGQPLRIKAGEKVSVINGQLGPVVPMTPGEIAALLNGPLFRGFQIPLGPPGEMQNLCRSLLPGYDCSPEGFPNPPSSPPTGPTSPPGPTPPPTTPTNQPVVTIACQNQVNTYLANLKATLGNTWSPPKPPRRGVWQVLVTYHITREGKVQNLQVVESSGHEPLDQAALAHVRSVEQNFVPFPACYPRDFLPVDQRFKLLYY